MTRNHARKVLLISADQWRGDHLGALGDTGVKTPNLDRLLAEGTGFVRHYASTAPCGPARASLLTGLYAMNHRSVRNGTPLDDRHTNIAREVRRTGVEPVLFGYTDTSADPRGRATDDPALCRYQGVLPGFSIGCDFADDRLDPWLAVLRAAGYPIPDDPDAIYQPVADYPDSDGRGHSYPPPVYRAEHSDTAFVADQVLNYMAVNRHSDWLIHAVFLRPHPPLYAPEPYNRLYDPTLIAPPVRLPDWQQEAAQHPYLGYWLEQQALPGQYTGHPVNCRDLPDHEIAQMKASYRGLISEVDYHIGRLIEQLKASGDYDRTLIVFTVDHGEMLGDHWLFGKGGYFEASYHIPLIIRDPYRTAGHGRRISQFTEAVDIMPTVLDWLGVEIPVTCDGCSLQPFLEGDSPDYWRNEVHWEFDFRDIVDLHCEQALGLTSDQCNLNVIRDQYYKYVHFNALPPLLFDLQRDPHEFVNRANDPDYQLQMLYYAQKLLSWRMAHADRTLTHQLLTPDGPIRRG